MSDVAPILTAHGEVRRLIPQEFTDTATGETRPRLRAEILTEGGFLTVTVPVALHEAHRLTIGKVVTVKVEARPWAFNNRTGTAYVLAAPAAA